MRMFSLLSLNWGNESVILSEACAKDAQWLLLHWHQRNSIQVEEKFYYIHNKLTFRQFMSHFYSNVDWLRLMFFLVRASSVGVALSRGHGKYFFRGNVSLEAGTPLFDLHF